MNLNIPEHLKEGLNNYIKHGIEPGSFLQAVLKNDLVGAIGAADHINRIRIVDIVEELYNSEEMPANCWGSEEAYKRHIISFTEVGRTMQITDLILNFINRNIDTLGSYNAEELTVKIGTLTAKDTLYAKKECKKFRGPLGEHPVEMVELIGLFIVHPTRSWEIPLN